MSVSSFSLYPFKSLFFRNKKAQNQDVAPPQQLPQRRREEDTFTFREPSFREQIKAGDRVTFDATAGPSLMAARQADIRSERLQPGPSRPVNGYAFTGVEIPYSRKQGKILSDREKVDILLNRATFQVPAKLMATPEDILMPGHKIQDLLEDTERPIFLEAPGDRPEVHELKITRLRQCKDKDEAHDEVILHRHADQSIESFVAQGFQNALKLGNGTITPQEAAHNPVANLSKNSFHYGANRKLIKEYLDEVQAEKKGKSRFAPLKRLIGGGKRKNSRFAQEHAQVDYFKSAAIPPDQAASLSPVHAGIAHGEEDTRSESSEYSEGSPQADYAPLPAALVNSRKQYAERVYDMVTPFPGEPKRHISVKEFPEILKKRLEKPSAEYLRLLEASNKRRNQGRTLEEAPLSRIQLLEDLFIHPDDRDYARGLTSQDEIRNVMARRYDKRTETEASPSLSLNIGADDKLSRVSAGSPEIVEVSGSSGSTPSPRGKGHPAISEIVEEKQASQPQLAQLSMEELNKEVAQAKRNTLGAALDAQAAADRLKALKKTPLPKLWNALMPQSRLSHEAIKEARAKLEQAEIRHKTEALALHAEDPVAAAHFEVKAAEAQLKALKKTPLPKWWNALMPQDKARHMAIKETQARLAQARINAQKAEALVR